MGVRISDFCVTGNHLASVRNRREIECRPADGKALFQEEERAKPAPGSVLYWRTRGINPPFRVLFRRMLIVTYYIMRNPMYSGISARVG